MEQTKTIPAFFDFAQIFCRLFWGHISLWPLALCFFFLRRPLTPAHISRLWPRQELTGQFFGVCGKKPRPFFWKFDIEINHSCSLHIPVSMATMDITPLEVRHSPWKMDDWNTILSFWEGLSSGVMLFTGRTNLSGKTKKNWWFGIRIRVPLRIAIPFIRES